MLSIAFRCVCHLFFVLRCRAFGARATLLPRRGNDIVRNVLSCCARESLPQRGNNDPRRGGIYWARTKPLWAYIAAPMLSDRDAPLGIYCLSLPPRRAEALWASLSYALLCQYITPEGPEGASAYCTFRCWKAGGGSGTRIPLPLWGPFGHILRERVPKGDFLERQRAPLTARALWAYIADMTIRQSRIGHIKCFAPTFGPPPGATSLSAFRQRC